MSAPQEGLNKRQTPNPSSPQAFQRCEKVNFQVLSKFKVSIPWSYWGSEGQGSSQSRFYRLSLDQRALQMIISLSCSLQKQLVTRTDNKLGQHPFISLKWYNSILCHFNRKILKQQQVLQNISFSGVGSNSGFVTQCSNG